MTQLPRLYTAASYCTNLGRPEVAVGYAQTAVGLQSGPGYQPFTNGWAHYMEAYAHLNVGRFDRHLEICAGLAEQTGLARLSGLCGLTTFLPLVGRSGEAVAIADDTMSAARAHTNPSFIAWAYAGCGRAYTESDPHRALDTFREGLAYTRQHRLPFWEAFIARDAAGLESVHGDFDQALDMFTASIDSFHQAGNTPGLATTFVNLTMFFDRTGRPEIAATFSGTTTHYPGINRNVKFAAVVGHLRNVLDPDTFDNCVRTGAAMTGTEAVHYAHHHIQLARQHQP